MADILNKDAPLASKPESIRNILAEKPNTQMIDDKPKFTDWGWINEITTVYLQTLSERGSRKRAVQAKEPAEDIRIQSGE